MSQLARLSSAVARRAWLEAPRGGTAKLASNPTFGYQIFVGQRNPTRNKLLQLAFAMKLSLRETNRLLQAGGCNELYCKNRRDAIIIFCINHGETLQAVDEQLYAFREDTITE